MLRKILLSVLVFFVFPGVDVCTGISQHLLNSPLYRQYHIQTWNLDAGAPPNIYFISQTPDGFLWLGSDKGAYTFDGITFLPVDGDTLSLGNECHAICVLHDSSVLCGFNNGKLIRYRHGRSNPIGSVDLFNGSTVSAICEDTDGSVWIGTYGAGLFRYSGGLFKTYTSSTGLLSDYITSIVRGHEGEIWAGTQEGLCRIEKGNVSMFTKKEGISHNYILSLWFDSQKRLWIGTHGGLNLYVNHAVQVIENDLLSNEADIYSITEDVKGNIWIASLGEGVFRFSPGLLKFEWLTDREGLPSNLVRYLFTDHEHGIWLGFEGNFGLSQLQQPVIQTYTTIDGLSGDNILPLFTTGEGTAWIGTANGGLDSYDHDRFTSHGASAGLGNNPVFSIAEDSLHHLWIGSIGKLIVYDGTKVLKTVSSSEFDVSQFHAVFKASDRSLWVGTDHGIVIFKNGKTRKLTRKDALSDDKIICFSEDQHGNIWIGTQDGGINIYHDGTIEHLSVKEGLSDELILCILEDKEGIMWVGTETGGLHRIDRIKGQITSFGKKSGLDNCITQIFEDDYGYLWLGIFPGILSVEKKSIEELMNGTISKLNPQIFTSSDLDQPFSLNGGIFPAGCKLPDGTLWFPTNHGIAVIYPDRMHGKVDFPQIVIQEVNVNHNLQPLAPSYVFPPAVIHMEIKFTAPTFISPDLIRFRYKLVGYDDEWIYPKGRSAYFTKIPYGSYTFQVQVTNRLGQWSDQTVSIPIRIKPFFHQTIWFLVICIFLGLFVIYAIVRYRIRQIREKELEGLVQVRTAELQELNRELDKRVLDRTAELAASNQELEAFSYSVSHDLRAPVRRIEGLIEAVMEDYAPQLDQTGKDFLGKIRSSTIEMNQLIEEFLKLARIARQEINKTDINLSGLGREIIEELSKASPERKVEISIQPGMKAAGDSKLLRIALLNLLGNAWKYTGKNPSAKIEFACREDEKQPVFYIRDNGVGFDMGHYEKLFTPFMRLHSDDQFTGTGIGLATVRRIILKHGGKIWAQSEAGKGAIFSFTL